MENFTFQYPSWLLIICVLLALVFAVSLYYRSDKWEDKGVWLKPTLWSLRFLSVALIGLLLLGPMIKTLLQETKEPSIVFLIDDSKSVKSWSNSNNIDLSHYLKTFHKPISDNYNVDIYTLSDVTKEVRDIDSIVYDAEVTNISKAIEYISDIYEGENLGAVVVASDGIYNEGKSPIYAKYNNVSPIYTIALGDTTRKKDLIAKNVLFNEVAYLNDEMSTQIDIQAYNASGDRARLIVQREEAGTWNTIVTKDIRLTEDNFFATQDILLQMDRAGVNHFRYTLSPINNESNRNNNVRDIYIEVLDARQEIGIIAHAPHPDITALKQILEQNKNYSVQVYYEDPSAQEIVTLDLVIFHNLPAPGHGVSNMLNELDRLKRPRIYVVGDQTHLPTFNASQTLVNIKGTSGTTNKAQAVIDKNFSNFTLTDALVKNVSSYPPLDAPFGEYKLQGNVQTLLHQQIGKIETDFPLLSFSDVDGIKTAYLFGSGIWRWKLFDFAQRQDFDIISELIDKSILYSSTKEDKRKFRINTSDNVYLENEEVVFSAELYNNSYELVNESEVRLVILNAQQEAFNFTLSKNQKTYSLNAGSLPEGRYRYQAETVYNGQKYEGSGRFVVSAIQYELYDLEARHNVLHALATQHRGSQYFVDGLEDLTTNLTANDQLKPVVYQNIIAQPLLDKKWLFGLLAILLVAEWFLRRFFGSL